ncbi:uncharacterized protein [Typha angustifolia]|uniref:uncharacterized protein n=1 Tax=Typha angustifolia TaxID=59011 RepID=UPI003C2EA343
MVQLPISSKVRPDVGVKLEVEDPLDEEHGPLNKRPKLVSPPPQDMSSNVLDEPSPLGLRLRKSPSLLDLIQMRLSQVNSTATMHTPSTEGSDLEKKKELKSAAVSGAAERLKASNFPATILRIGTWECISRYEGDLVAKCYFAKHKLVWEVLEGGLKSKIEIQWPDITALKATCPEDGPGTLDVVLSRPPLFFRETDPQPRKHTLWQATSDFTGGQASIQRRHFLQCPSGLLGKNFEKLIQCDARLHFLSQQPDIILESPCFETRCSVFEDPTEQKKCHVYNNSMDGYESTFSGFTEHGSPCGTSSLCAKSEISDSVGKEPQLGSQVVTSSRSGPGFFSIADTRAVEESSCSGGQDVKNPNWWDQLKVTGLGLRGSMSMDDLVSHIGHCISEQITSGNPSLPSNALPTKEILENITQHLLSDTQNSSASDEKSLMARVNSLCCLIQKDTAAAVQDPQTRIRDGVPADDDSEGSDNELNSGAGNESSDDAQPPPISRKESFGELLMHLPRIASLPQFLFNISEDSEDEAR